MKGQLLLVALVFLAAGATAQRGDNWIKQTLKLGNDVTFNCTENGTWPNEPDFMVPEDSVIVGWMFPKFKIVNISFSDSKHEVLEEGEKFLVRNISRADLGVYHCVHKTPNGTIFLVKWGLNMKGPYFEDLWEKYRMNTIIGLSAAGGFTVLAVAVVLIWTFRWQAPKEEYDSQLSNYMPQGLRARQRIGDFGGDYINGYDNAAFKTEMKEEPPADYNTTFRPDDTNMSASMKRYIDTPADGKMDSTKM